MDHEAADRIGDAAERDPDSATAQSAFDDRTAELDRYVLGYEYDYE